MDEAIIKVPQHLFADQTAAPSKNDIIAINSLMKSILHKMENDHDFPLTFALRFCGLHSNANLSTRNAEIIRQNFESAGYIAQTKTIMNNFILIIDQPRMLDRSKKLKIESPPPYSKA